jgi:hypothetical protein
LHDCITQKKKPNIFYFNWLAAISVCHLILSGWC